MTCWYKITKIFCSKYGCATALSSGSPCYLGPEASIAVAVLRKASNKTVLTDTTFLRGSEADSREELAGASLCALEHFRPQDFP